MAVAPRLSLRSLVLLMSHGKPRLSSFFSSSSYLPPPAAPAVQPPAAPAVPDPGRKNNEGVGHPLPDPPNRKHDAVIDKPLPSTPDHPIPDCGSYSNTPAPLPDIPQPKPSNDEHVPPVAELLSDYVVKRPHKNLLRRCVPHELPDPPRRPSPI